jgi:hypothetical protein
VEGVRQNGKGGHVFVGHLASRRVVVRVELALDSQARCGRGRRDQLQDHRVADEWLAAPILANLGKEAMLNLVPFTGSRRQVAHRE